MQQTLDLDATDPIALSDTPTRPLRHTPPMASPHLWGEMALALGGACALVVVAVSGTLSRFGSNWAQPLFWVAILGFYVACVGLMSLRSPCRSEALAVAIVATLVISSVKVMLSPASFTQSDEFIHLRTLSDIMQTGHLFAVNALLPASPQFPGLELATNAIAQASGVSPFIAGTILILCVRFLFALVIFRLGEVLFGTPKYAGLAVLLVLCNSQSLFFNTQFAYETLAIPLALLAFYGVLRGATLPRVPIYLLLAAIAVTHHMTSYIFALLLLSLGVVSWVLRRGTEPQHPPWLPGIVMVGMAVGWTMSFGYFAIDYLLAAFHANGQQFILFVTGRSAARHLFADYAGQAMPIWERGITVLSLVIVTLCLPIGSWEIWRRHRGRRVIILLGLLAWLYPVVQVLRLTPGGGEIPQRLATFLFVGIAVVLLFVGDVLRRRVVNPRIVGSVGGIGLLVMFWGGILLSGNPNWNLLPGSFLVAAEQRSVDAEGIDAARWAAQTQTPHQLVFADRTNRFLMSTYGNQDPQTLLYDKRDLSVIYLHPYLTQSDRTLIRASQVHALEIDYRMTQQLPRLGVYFEMGESQQFRYMQPLSAGAFDKFDGAVGFDRIYDGGDIVIYRLNGGN